MSDLLISIEGLTHKYVTYEKSEGLLGTFRDFFNRTVAHEVALADVSFNVKQGEMVGLLGPNGAGKTTLVKILAGLIHPSAGAVEAMGHIPSRKSRAYLSQIGLVLGQKSQLMWDLPPADTLALLKEVYRVGHNDYRSRLDYLLNLLGVTEQFRTPVRKLSLGQRMKFELMAALLHNPRLLFLDEPTIGLDISSQRAIHGFLRRVNKELGTTIILTSHYARDIEALANRVLILRRGRLQYDGGLPELLASHRSSKIVRVETGVDLQFHPLGFRQVSEGAWECEIMPEQLNQALSSLAEITQLQNVSTVDRPLEDVLYAMFSQDANSEEGMV